MTKRSRLEQIAYLTEASARMLKGCRVAASDGTILYTPDGEGNYKGLWTRDFAYMVQNAGRFMPADEVAAGIRYIMQGQREDGALPDRMRPDGVAIYAAGADGAPIGEANLDNVLFLVIAVDEYIKLADRAERLPLFAQYADAIDRAMDFTPLSPAGLVYNDAERPHSPYGFTDTVCKTGELFFESLLFWESARRLETLYTEIGDARRAAKYRQAACATERAISQLWDEGQRAFVAATGHCRQIDIWGMAYAIEIDFPLLELRDAVLDYLHENYDRYVLRGQVRHLPAGEYWEKLLIEIAPETYQNGAYWATASGWVIKALALRDPALAENMLADAVEDFETTGICECVNRDYIKLPNFVVSATNVLAAAMVLEAMQN